MRAVVEERPSLSVTRGMGATTIVAWLAVAGIVVGLDPDPLVHRIGFFLALAVALASATGLAAYRLSFRVFASRRHRGNVERAILHGVVTSLVLTAAALLQLGRALSLLNVALLGGVFLILQLVVLLRR